MLIYSYRSQQPAYSDRRADESTHVYEVFYMQPDTFHTFPHRPRKIKVRATIIIAEPTITVVPDTSPSVSITGQSRKVSLTGIHTDHVVPARCRIDCPRDRWTSESTKGHDGYKETNALAEVLDISHLGERRTEDANKHSGCGAVVWYVQCHSSW